MFPSGQGSCFSYAEYPYMTELCDALAHISRTFAFREAEGWYAFHCCQIPSPLFLIGASYLWQAKLVEFLVK